LGDADVNADDTLKWIKKAKKREKELAKKRMEELESLDKHFQGEDHIESTSVGVR
jgi:U4/U6.U5 tri-snRNP-associated protein 1